MPAAGALAGDGWRGGFDLSWPGPAPPTERRPPLPILGEDGNFLAPTPILTLLALFGPIVFLFVRMEGGRIMETWDVSDAPAAR